MSGHHNLTYHNLILTRHLGGYTSNKKSAIHCEHTHHNCYNTRNTFEKIINQPPPQARFFSCPIPKELVAFVLLLLHSDRGVLNSELAARWIRSSTHMYNFALWIICIHIHVHYCRVEVPSRRHAPSTCSLIVDVHTLVVPSMKAGRKLHIEASFSLNWEQMAHLKVATWSPDIQCSYHSILIFFLYTSQVCSSVIIVWLPDVIVSTVHVQYLCKK